MGLSEIEWFAGNPPAAEEGFRSSCDFVRDVGNNLNLPDAVIALAELLVVLGRDDEVLEQTDEIPSSIAAVRRRDCSHGGGGSDPSPSPAWDASTKR